MKMCEGAISIRKFVLLFIFYNFCNEEVCYNETHAASRVSSYSRRNDCEIIFCLYLIYNMARIVPISKQQITVSKLVTKDID